jgi:hypothetical protein
VSLGLTRSRAKRVNKIFRPHIGQCRQNLRELAHQSHRDIGGGATADHQRSAYRLQEGERLVYVCLEVEVQAVKAPRIRHGSAEPYSGRAMEPKPRRLCPGFAGSHDEDAGHAGDVRV